MPFGSGRSTAARGREDAQQAPPAWADTLTAPGAARAQPASAGASEQLSLFMHDDDPACLPARKPPRLRRLKGLLAALESQRSGLEDLFTAVPAEPASASRDPAAQETSPTWPESFFD